MKNRLFFDCKYPNEIHELKVLHPIAHLIFADLSVYCWHKGYPMPVITSIGRTVDENEAEEATSTSHIDLRAFDISSKAYTAAQIKDISDYVCAKYNNYAAMNAKGEARLVVYHKTKNGAFHFHFQIHKRYALPYFTGEVMPSGTTMGRI